MLRFRDHAQEVGFQRYYAASRQMPDLLWIVLAALLSAVAQYGTKGAMSHELPKFVDWCDVTPAKAATTVINRVCLGTCGHWPLLAPYRLLASPCDLTSTVRPILHQLCV